MRRGQGNNLPASIRRPGEVEALRQRALIREPIPAHEALTLLASHENLRAYALAARHRLMMVERERDELILAMRREETAKSTLKK